MPITPCLWFDNQAEQAAAFYTSIFPRSKITSVTHYGPGAPQPAGSVMTVTFELDGQPYMALNGGPHFTFTPAVSFVLKCDSQDELDRLTATLIEGGGAQHPCGWVQDRFGLSWQVVPSVLDKLVGGDDARAHRVMSALLQMQKLDIAALVRAYEQ